MPSSHNSIAIFIAFQVFAAAIKNSRKLRKGKADKTKKEQANYAVYIEPVLLWNDDGD